MKFIQFLKAQDEELVITIDTEGGEETERVIDFILHYEHLHDQKTIIDDRGIIQFL